MKNAWNGRNHQAPSITQAPGGSSLLHMAQSLSREVRSRYAEEMVLELERVALGLFEERGVAEVTVEEIAADAGISPRTFYRHFAGKDDIFQVRIERHASALRLALGERPAGEPPLRSLREALVKVVSHEDSVLRRRWMLVVESSPNLVRAALGGVHLKVNTVMADFFGDRLGLPAADLVPAMLSAAAGGVVFAANATWLLEGGLLEERLAQALDVLETVLDVDALGSPPPKR
jgi:AcrR family transcriptional regulator